MLNNNLVFSFILSLANTLMYYLFNTNKYESIGSVNNRNQELIMVFGISFSMCFFMKSISSNTTISKNISIPKNDIVMSHSSRPPF
jgi:hypothetical protein